MSMHVQLPMHVHADTPESRAAQPYCVLRHGGKGLGRTVVSGHHAMCKVRNVQSQECVGRKGSLIACAVCAVWRAGYHCMCCVCSLVSRVSTAHKEVPAGGLGALVDTASTASMYAPEHCQIALQGRFMALLGTCRHSSPARGMCMTRMNAGPGRACCTSLCKLCA